MTEEERLALVAVIHKLDHLDMLMLGCAGLILAVVRPTEEGGARAASIAEKALQEQKESARKFQDCIGRLNEMGVECSE